MIRSFQRGLVVFNNLLIQFFFIHLCLEYLVQSFKWKFELGVWEMVFFPIQKDSKYSFNFLFDIFLEQYMFGQYTTVSIRGFGLSSSFYQSKSVSDFFYYTLSYYVPTGVIEDRVTKISSKCFNGKLRSSHESWLINSIFICSSP